MRDIKQLEKDFELYYEEIRRCLENKCYWALLHILLTIPDVCAKLETDPENRKQGEVGERYINWCNNYFSSNTNISGEDRYQMRCALFHSGSTTASNISPKHCTQFMHFSYVTPDEFDVQIHGSACSEYKILNIHTVALAQETIAAIHNWFIALQGEKSKLGYVDANIGTLSRLQSKQLGSTTTDFKKSNRTTISST